MVDLRLAMLTASLAAKYVVRLRLTSIMRTCDGGDRVPRGALYMGYATKMLAAAAAVLYRRRVHPRSGIVCSNACSEESVLKSVLRRKRVHPRFGRVCPSSVTSSLVQHHQI